MAGSDLPKLGVLAFGDSITNGGGELQWGVALQSWALWTARGLGLPYTGCAVDGARLRDVLSAQIPGFLSITGEARYDVGCLYAGVNDVRAPDWDAASFSAHYPAVLGFLTGRCERTLALTAPLALGLPAVDVRRVERMNATVREAAAAAAAAGVLVVDLSDFGARNHVMADRVHPTAFGQIAIARRALAVLAADGLPTRVDPATLIGWESSRRRRLRGDCVYVYRRLKLSVAAVAAAAARLGARRGQVR